MKRQTKLWMSLCLIFSLFFATLTVPEAKVVAAQVNLETKTQALVISPQSERSLQIVGFYQILNRSANVFQGHVEVPLPADYENIDPGVDPTMAQFDEQSLFVSQKIEANDETGVQGRYVCEFSLKDGEGVLSYKFPTDISALLIQFPVGVQDVTFVGLDVQDAGDENNVHSYVAEKVRAGQTLEIYYKLKEDGLKKFEQIKQEAAASQNASNNNEDANTSNETPQTAQTQQTETTNNVTRNSPSFHSAGHIRLWKTSVLGSFDPHLFLILMGTIIIAGISLFTYFAAKRHKEAKKALNSKEEQEFQQLMKRKRAIMEKIVELEEKHQASKVSEEEFKQKNLAYKKLLAQVNQELTKFID